MGKQIGDHAVVLGGSIAGMLSARVLSEAYSRVTVIERDDLTDVGSGLRPSIPWAIHIHALLERGREIIEDLFPGFVDDMLALDVPVGDYGTTCHYYANGTMFAEAETGLACVGANRPVIENFIRTRTSAIPGVAVRDGTDIVGLRPSADNTRITGVRVQGRDRDAGAGREEIIEADLVIDATGRASRTPRWLEELGYTRAPEEKVHMDLTYTTMDFIGPLPNDPLGEDIALVPTATPTYPRGAIFARLADRYALTLTGINGDSAPTDREGFLAYAKSLPVPEIYEAVRDAEQRAHAGAFRFPASVRRRYERLRRFPEGYLVIGDAACIFNPVYAQGMTVAAMGAAVLRKHLEKGVEPQPGPYFRDLARTTDAPWSMSAAADLGHPKVRGRRTFATRMANMYMPRVQAAATSDPVVARRFIRAISLVDPPQELMKPSVVGRVLFRRGARGATRAPAGSPGTSPVANTAAQAASRTDRPSS
ncbi:FAD-binding monooxygenase [Haloechinothrix sp. YIM 98757]|uniref:FAD-binding monooxygenase n=1 Tax=Haloechinothrix aidingensis TaxID=2752311 RepID=A0A838A9H4_9PSEU|nr:FAD-binding monooxygenase [Haloechinothrix aidingensis]MBA0125312.1 FAD-binding monooxygenase [Haloechinothrix aidingensis]